MEVHHHPHVEKKRFKEYLLEGLMIFFAVMMGFFAESFREYITEHRQAREYAATMETDLESDTADLNSYIQYYGYAATNIDSLMVLTDTLDPKEIVSGKLYWYGLWGGAQGAFIPHDATIHQMESSGSLRYFKNMRLSRSVAEYYQLCRKWEDMEAVDRSIYPEVRKARAKIFEFKYNEAANEIYQKNKIHFRQESIDSFMKSTPPLLSYDKVLFNEYLELVRSRYLSRKVAFARNLLKQAVQLMDELKKQYPG